MALYEKKDFKKANESFKECLKLNPRFALAWKAIGHIFYETNNSENACKYYSRAIHIEPNDVEAKIGIV